ncbi:hypothetical protein Q5P01_023355 [Channa striata]|uniref:Uncharacterized protein n=1 Tax=Channa striata TaxID=64152 RepID=A0AA88IP25_CHASR|nr:hypothetical protein Q5P01_023355 [Channa striata]
MSIDIRAEFDRVIKQMEWGEVLDTLQDVIGDALGVTPEPVPTTPPPPALPAELEHDIRFEAVGEVHEVHVGCSSHHLGIAPHISDAPNVMHTDPLYCQQAGVHSQEQHALYESAVYDHPGSTTAAYYPAAPPHTWALLSQEEKAKYYEQAEKEKLLYAMQNPGWSSSNNYVPAASTPEHVQEEMEQTALMEALTSNAALEMRHTQDMDP